MSVTIPSPAELDVLKNKLIEVFGARPAFTIMVCLHGVQRALEMFEDQPDTADVRLTLRQIRSDLHELHSRSRELLGEQNADMFLELLVGNETTWFFPRGGEVTIDQIHEPWAAIEAHPWRSS